MTVNVFYGLLATPNAWIWEIKTSPAKVTMYGIIMAYCGYPAEPPVK